MENGCLIAARLGLYLSLGLLAGLPLYRALVARDPAPFSRPIFSALILMALGFTGFGLLTSASAMAGTPITQPDWSAVQMMLHETDMGLAIKVRIAALLLLLVLPARPWLLLLPAMVALATLAWNGHAAASEGSWGQMHLVADMLHMLAAATWLGALASFLLAALRGHDTLKLSADLAHFARAGSVIVALLLLTGVVNVVMIVGIAGLPALLSTNYGWILGAKLLLFAGMLGLAGANRWLLTPKLEREAPGARTHLRLSLMVETALWIGVIALVAYLGTLDPQA